MGKLDFQVTVNDASKTKIITSDVKKEDIKSNKKEGKINVNETKSNSRKN